MFFSSQIRTGAGIILLAAIFSLGSSPFAAAYENIRVAVADDQQTVTIKSPAGLKRDDVAAPAGTRVVYRSNQIGKAPVRIASRGTFVQVNGKSFRGWIELRKKRNGLLVVINDLDIEDYLKGVVAAEIPHDWEFEALKAQAVAARTYALYQKRTGGARAFHIRATVDGQMYQGRSGEHEAAIRAVRETAGEVVTYQGEVIPAFYHASCGGHTEDAFELWGLDVPYLKGVDCECQEISRYGLWEKRFTPEQISRSLIRIGYRLTGITDIAIDGITPAGRVKRLLIRHERGETPIPAEKLRTALGYSSLPSVFFEIERSGNEFIISGRGLGHGVGLCQWGAREMAQRGFDYRAILAHYYPGTTVDQIRENR